jgi:hypothetical protein
VTSGVTMSSSCNYSNHLNTPAINNLHELPRFNPPSFIYKLNNESTDDRSFNFFSEDYLVSLSYTTAIYCFGTYLIFCALLLLASCFTCCHGDHDTDDDRSNVHKYFGTTATTTTDTTDTTDTTTTTTNRRRKVISITSRKNKWTFYALLFLHITVLMICGLTSVLPFIGSKKFGDGVNNIVSSYNIATNNFSDVDEALNQLHFNLNNGEYYLSQIIHNNPCHSSYSENLLKETYTQLNDAQSAVTSIVTLLTPINTSMIHIHSAVIEYYSYGEAIRTYCILLPMCCTILYTVLEIIVSCNSLPRCSSICCVVRLVARLIGWVTLTCLIVSTFIYGIIGIGSSDYCSAPDKHLVDSVNHYESINDYTTQAMNIGEFFKFYTTCQMSNKISTINEFQQKLIDVHHTMNELQTGISAWNALCPKTSNTKLFQAIFDDCYGIYNNDINIFQKCSSIQPQYCTFVENGICGPLITGAYYVAMTQGVCSIVLFISLLFSFCLASNTSWKKQLIMMSENENENENGRLENIQHSSTPPPLAVVVEEVNSNNRSQLTDLLLANDYTGSFANAGSASVVPSRFQSVHDYIGEGD